MYIKKAISVILISMILCCSLPTFYATEETPIQDLDYGFVADPYERLGTSLEDETVELATMVSKYLAGLVTLDDRQMLAADANRDGLVNLFDVRCIQEITIGM